MEKIITREMTITHNDFLRLIPRALKLFDHEIFPGNCEIKINHPCGEITIKLSPESVRSIGSLRLPVTEIEFIFAGFSQQELDKFLYHFDLCYQRGGG